MALISKLQKRSKLIIFFIGLSILAFVLADALPRLFMGGSSYRVGKINGSNISRQDYEEQLSQMNGSGYPAQQIKNQVWSNLLFQYLIEPEINKLGIGISNEEFSQMLVGDSLFMHPQIKAQFRDSTGKFDKKMLLNYIENIKKAKKSRAPNARQSIAMWDNFTDNIKKSRKIEKYQALMVNSSYVTSHEAQRNYEEQTAKRSVKYLYVPYSSIADTNIQIDDKQLNAILKKNANEYKTKANISVGYVAIPVEASKEDSIAMADNLKTYARNLAAAQNDSIFVSNLGIEFKGEYKEQSLKDIPSEIFDKQPMILKGGIYGPVKVQVQIPLNPRAQMNPYQRPQMKTETRYRIIKVSEEIEDSIAYARARHILIKIDTSNADAAREKAKDILERVQNGEDFGTLAQKESQDPGSGSKGGDLGFFDKQTMVKPFANAVFNMSEAGVVPNLVKSQFGYHIIKVTTPPTKKKFKIASIDTKLNYSDDTKDEFYLQANKIATEAKDYNSLKALIEKDSTSKYKFVEQGNLQSIAQNLGGDNARNAILWAFQDKVKAGQVSCPIFLNDSEKYVIVALKERFKDNQLSINAFRPRLKSEAIKEAKKEIILKKFEGLGDNKKDNLESIAKKYGKEAQTGEAKDLLINASTFGSVGFNPRALGVAFGLKKGERSKAFADNSGVFIIQSQEVTVAPKIADYNKYKTDLEKVRKQRAPMAIGQALEDIGKVEDIRYKTEANDPCSTK